MADHPLLLQVGQYAFESVNGTPVAATKRLSGVTLSPGPRADRSPQFSTGDQYARGTTTNQEWSEIGIEGSPGYNEITPLVTLFAGAPTITTPPTGVNARQHEWKGVNGTIPALKSITYEYGDSNRGNQIAFVFGQDLTFTLARGAGGFTVGGTLIGQAMTDPFSLSGGATALPFMPIEGVDADTYVDSTYAGLGVTKLLRAASGSFGLSGIQQAFYALNSAQSSFATAVPARPDATSTLRLGADSVGRPLALSYRAGERKFVRWEAKNGIEIDTGVPATVYRFTLDMCLEVIEPGDFDEETGLMVIEPTFQIVNDDTAGFAWRIQVVNTQLAI